MGLLSWLGGSNDRELADTRYAGRESASDRAARRRGTFGKPSRTVAEADRKGQRWEDKGRSKEVGTDWYRR